MATLKTVSALAVAALFAFSAPALAVPGKSKADKPEKTEKSEKPDRIHKEMSKDGDKEKDRDGDRDRVHFSDRDRETVRDYFHTHADSLPPGLAKRENLPPGLQKQLERNGTLPPGLAKRSLPKDLEGRLNPLNDPYERVIVGEDLILLDPETNLILDVMQGVFGVPVDDTLGKAGAHRDHH